jgi:protoporphyrinogen oxidase
MKVAILGGGFTGLTAAYYERKKGHNVVIMERDDHLGGLASGFKEDHWDWTLERAYHHMFATDSHTLELAKEIGYGGIFFKTPHTDSLYNGKPYALDTPLDLIKFPLLSFIDRLRIGVVVALLKISPPLPYYETQTAAEFCKKFMGTNGWNIFLRELFRKKFGKYAENILASFVWARFKVRTRSLGYMKGGFQTFVNHLETTNATNGVEIRKGYEVNSIEQKKGKLYVNKEEFDKIISTLPTPILVKITENLFPQSYLQKFTNLKFLHAVNLILETKEPILKTSYWLSVCDPNVPIMVLVQQTNFIDKKNYGGSHILYVGNYVEKDSGLLKMDKQQALTYFLPHIKKIHGSSFTITNSYLFKAPFAQPVFDKDFLENKPDFITPIKNFYIANLDMTYPNDRGTNYAIKLGKEVSEISE